MPCRFAIRTGRVRNRHQNNHIPTTTAATPPNPPARKDLSDSVVDVGAPDVLTLASSAGEGSVCPSLVVRPGCAPPKATQTHHGGRWQRLHSAEGQGIPSEGLVKGARRSLAACIRTTIKSVRSRRACP